MNHGDTNSFIKDKPILVIDDEVDSGSVDTGEQQLMIKVNLILTMILKQLIHE